MKQKFAIIDNVHIKRIKKENNVKKINNDLLEKEQPKKEEK